MSYELSHLALLLFARRMARRAQRQTLPATSGTIPRRFHNSGSRGLAHRARRAGHCSPITQIYFDNVEQMEQISPLKFVGCRNTPRKQSPRGSPHDRLGLSLSSGINPVANFYALAAWRRARRQALYDAGYRCERCGCSLVGMGPNAHVHHRKPRARARAIELEPLNLMAVCIRCHNQIEPRDGSKPKPSGSNEDGSPSSPDHPWNMTLPAHSSTNRDAG